MSEFKVPLTTIKEIFPHTNPDVLRLQIAVVYGFQVVIPKDRYKVGDTVLYMPIDSVLPSDLESFLFPEGTKIKLHNSRIKQIRIQKFPSQGMLVSIEDLKKFTNIEKLPPVETDMAEVLKVVKYEPPAPNYQGPSKTGQKKSRENTWFHKYNGLENIKWYPNLFQEGDEVVIQEKLHGSNCRAAKLMVKITKPINNTPIKVKVNRRRKQLKQLLSLTSNINQKQLKFLYGSNNVEISGAKNYTGFYGDDVYGKVLEKVGASEKIKKGEVIFGELIGAGIQKNYDYGHKKGHHFVLFDVKILQEDGTYKWLTPDEAEAYAKERGFDFVPVLYKGPYIKELAYSMTKGDSVYHPAQKIREGIVIKGLDNYNNLICPNGRKSLKWISEDYLDKNNSDFH